MPLDPAWAYGPWTEYGPFEQVYDYAGSQYTQVYLHPGGYGSYASVRSTGLGRGGTYRLSQSFAAHAAGHEPWEHHDDRVCCLRHAIEEPGTAFDAFWDQDVCRAVFPSASSPLSDGSGGGGGGAWSAGTVASYSYGGLPMIGDTYSVSSRSAMVGVWRPGSRTGTGAIDFTSPEDLYRVSVPAEVLMQVPGWFDYISTHRTAPDTASVYAPPGPQPQAYPVQVDAFGVRLHVSSDSPSTGVTVNAHARGSDALGVPPASAATGSVDMSVAGTPGATSAALSFGDMQWDDKHKWHVVTDLMESLTDPGEPPNAETPVVKMVSGGVDVRALWTIMLRFPLPVPDVLTVLRWRQRDDGLGITGAARHRTGTSLQRGLRQRGYR